MGHLYPSAEFSHVSWARLAATDNPTEQEADATFGTRVKFAHTGAFM